LATRIENKAAKLLEIEKQKGNINKYLKKDEKSLDIEESNQKNEQEIIKLTEKQHAVCESTNFNNKFYCFNRTFYYFKRNGNTKRKWLSISNTSEFLINLRDPATWPDINEKIIIENDQYRHTDYPTYRLFGR